VGFRALCRLENTVLKNLVTGLVRVNRAVGLEILESVNGKRLRKVVPDTILSE